MLCAMDRTRHSACARCTATPHGSAGHEDLEPTVEGPFAGQHLYWCVECGDRWIRHEGRSPATYQWTRAVDQFPNAVRKPAPTRTSAGPWPF